MTGDRFRVFISWSGERSKAVGEVWHDLVQESFDTVEPFMSEETIGAGKRGLNDIAGELAGTAFGIVVVTQENQSSAWLNFEAGALSKNVADPTVRVAPSLVDFVRKTDMSGPLTQFQASLLDFDGVEKILTEIAKVVGLNEASIKKRLANSWDEYKVRFDTAKAVTGTHGGEPEPRSNDDKLDELLNLVRELSRQESVRSSGGARIGKLSRPIVVLSPGDQIIHEKYGTGRVEEVSGMGESAMSLIDFGAAGRVKLMHNHAPLRLLMPDLAPADDDPPF